VHRHILSQLCMPISAIYPSKYLLGKSFSFDDIPPEVVRHKFHESIFILRSPTSLPDWAVGHTGESLSYLKIRRSRGTQRSIRLSQTFRLTSESKKIERRSALSREEFLDTLSSSLDQSRLPVVKDIESFKYQGTAFTIESLNIGGKITRFLRIESEAADQSQLIPKFMAVEGDVSSRPNLNFSEPKVLHPKPLSSECLEPAFIIYESVALY
jgi:hypothetical protein